MWNVFIPAIEDDASTIARSIPDMCLSESIEQLSKIMLTVHTISKLKEDIDHGLSKIMKLEAQAKRYEATTRLSLYENGEWYALTTGNYLFAFDIFKRLLEQYKERFGKGHVKEHQLTTEIAYPPKEIPAGPVTACPMPTHQYVKKDTVKEEYREIFKRNKPIAGWRNPGAKPSWW